METNVQRIKQDIEQLAQFTATPKEGVTRFSFTPEDRAARNYIKDEMQRAGLAVSEDAAGTVIGRRQGQVEGPTVMLGSHFDSVKHGGAFDGTAGVVVAMEIARVLNEHNITTHYPIEFIAMIEEEGGRFGGGLFASRAMAGMVTEEELIGHCDEAGVSLAQAMREFGLDPANIKAAQRRPEELKAFFELHVEQGPILESEGTALGLVEAIVGLKTYQVKITGRPDHAGTTPIHMRADALLAASEVVQQVRQIARDVGGGAVGTVGKMEVLPGASNIVPGEVHFTVDLRSHRESALEELSQRFQAALKEACSKEEGLSYTLTTKLDAKPAQLSDQLRNVIAEEAKARGISAKTMISGAGHDTQIMATLTDAALIFVPSKGGRSHCPEEWTDYADLKKGADVLLGAVLAVAEGK
ncbi:MAG: Zn-dependent hydrolase [Firmicutes bacterium]|nr:Zn-dependent hydrolase [Bacillota bacterium]